MSTCNHPTESALVVRNARNLTACCACGLVRRTDGDVWREPDEAEARTVVMVPGRDLPRGAVTLDPFWQVLREAQLRCEAEAKAESEAEVEKSS